MKLKYDQFNNHGLLNYMYSAFNLIYFSTHFSAKHLNDRECKSQCFNQGWQSIANRLTVTRSD